MLRFEGDIPLGKRVGGDVLNRATTASSTIEILDNVVRKARRHITWGKEVLDTVCNTDGKRERRVRRQQELQKQLHACGGVTGDIGDRT